jgi:Flp pilus assembly protein TadG
MAMNAMQKSGWGRLGRRGRDDRGQALVEFALLVPILLLLILGVVEFGRAWNAYQVITDAAREGARVAVVNNTSANVADSVEFTVRSAMGRAGLDHNTATIDLQGVGGDTGTSATVAISFPFQFRWLGPLMKWAVEDATIALRTAFVMRNE